MKYLRSEIFSGSVLESKVKPLSIEGVFTDSLISFEVFVSEFSLDLSNSCGVEETVFNLLNTCGFSLQHKGTKYLFWILITATNEFSFPLKSSDYYILASRFFDVPSKYIEIAISRVIENASLKQLHKINTILDSNVLNFENPISAGEFLTNVTARLIMLKAHEKGKTFFANHNYKNQ
ncbi:MAG: hypothetical protein FWE13_00375 [Firmicutes bacterium]|nr:hypothetical protein [Bacillota bacterium]